MIDDELDACCEAELLRIHEAWIRDIERQERARRIPALIVFYGFSFALIALVAWAAVSHG